MPSQVAILGTELQLWASSGEGDRSAGRWETWRERGPDPPGGRVPRQEAPTLLDAASIFWEGAAGNIAGQEGDTQC